MKSNKLALGQFFATWVIDYIALLVVRLLFQGSIQAGVVQLIVTAVVLAALDALIKPLLVILSLPITIITFGLFALIINGLILYISFSLTNVDVASFSTVVFAAIVVSLARGLLELLNN